MYCRVESQLHSEAMISTMRIPAESHVTLACCWQMILGTYQQEDQPSFQNQCTRLPLKDVAAEAPPAYHPVRDFESTPAKRRFSAVGNAPGYSYTRIHRSCP